jgi:hypothetical protein
VLTSNKGSDAVALALRKVADRRKTRGRRSMRRFAEEEIVLPSGPHKDERLRVALNPWLGLWLDEIDSGRWRGSTSPASGRAARRSAAPRLPVMYHLFECRETTVYAAPTIEMANDKWKQDVLPAIEASDFKDLMPEQGRGSRGGTALSHPVPHGPTLRFMTGGGDDKVRAGFTARAAVITETDGMDEAGGSSRETDKINQVESRTNAFGDRARVYMECTTSIETGRTWRELKDGTDSRIVLPCPHCRRGSRPSASTWSAGRTRAT